MSDAPTHAHTMLDDAWSASLGGKREDALRRCIALLEADAMQLGAAALAIELLVDAERPFVATEVAERLVDAYVRRGDLPGAAAAAAIVKKAGEDPTPHFRTISQAFGRGAPRLSDVPIAPPPLPRAPKIDAPLAKAAGSDLLDRAESAVKKLLAADDPVDANAKVSQLPLFSALPPAALERLLAGLAVRALPGGAHAIEQGQEGREAFVVVRGILRAQRRGADGAEGDVLAMLGPGAIFGEMALVSEAPRAASVVALEPVQLLVAARDALEALAQKEPAIGKELAAFCRNRMMANLVRHSAILNAVAPAQRDELVTRFETRTFQPGETLVAQGEEAEGLFLLASGAVRVTGKDADGDRIVIAELGPGDVVGEISLVLRRPATATVTASHATVALHLPRDRFHEAIREHATLLSELYELATKREEETRSVVGQQALDVEDIVLL
jgi:cAMP-dependent protein kinase regulator